MRTTILLGGLLLALHSPAAAQSNGSGFGLGHTDIGPTVGLGGIGSAGLSLGARFERAIKYLPNLGKGTLGIQVGADYYHYSDSFGATNYGFTFIPIGATLNYHVHLNDGKFDPFVGAGLGYAIFSSSFTGTGGAGGGIYFIGRAGLRYFVSNGMALYGEVGAGAATINAGMMFRMGKAQ